MSDSKTLDTAIDWTEDTSKLEAFKFSKSINCSSNDDDGDISERVDRRSSIASILEEFPHPIHFPTTTHSFYSSNYKQKATPHRTQKSWPTRISSSYPITSLSLTSQAPPKSSVCTRPRASTDPFPYSKNLTGDCPYTLSSPSIPSRYRTPILNNNAAILCTSSDRAKFEESLAGNDEDGEFVRSLMTGENSFTTSPRYGLQLSCMSRSECLLEIERIEWENENDNNGQNNKPKRGIIHDFGVENRVGSRGFGRSKINAIKEKLRLGRSREEAVRRGSHDNKRVIRLLQETLWSKWTSNT